ncbi:efflux transporter outer membrane subunit [Caballeronia sp. LZ043]|uniref:efflux transporter outer membrane subunit n=1 Tax=Caballeronia sp. LZ043 TaxID=3038569 RepID=UPI00285C2937|nr:efflux transporter outer membrane subunit [Caballeronia sp. LZ043]MDR5821652.1 efflux transporter outer membrane subunit [Caballeronia sp. LZ043]
MFPRTIRFTALLALTAFALAACTVGPDYHGAHEIAPDAAKNGAFVRAPAEGIVATHAPAAWWQALNDPQLNTLIDAALTHNPDLKMAQARLRQARSQLRGQRANELPKVSGSAAALRMRSPDTSFFSSSDDSGAPASTGRGPVDFYTVGFDASWEIDLFGGTRRAIEAASDEADAVHADLSDTQVSLAAEVASAYIDLRDQQERLALAERTAEYQQQMLDLTEQRRARGTAAQVDVERLTTQVDTTRATLVPLQVQITDSLDQLAVLTGRAPGALDGELAARAPLPVLPATVAIGDPAAMLQQRPDIRAAERRLASSNAQIGEHIADYFPKVSLLGDIGFSAADPGHLLRKQNFSWVGVPYLQWNLFDFGRTAASVDTARASREEAEARYEKTVLGALKDANSSLSRYGNQREHVVRLQQVEASAERSATLVRQRYRAGVSTLIDLLDAQRTQFAAQQDVVAAKAELLKDFVSLQKSLGLGWQDPRGA